MVRLAFLALLLIASPVLAQSDSPSVTRTGGTVVVHLPSSVLQQPGVRTQLGTALTTTFLIEVRLRGTSEAFIQRREVRYDLWDEVFHVKRVSEDDQAESARLKSRGDLEAWWRMPLSIPAGTAFHIAEVEIIVLPFSAAEARDARRWLSRSRGAGAASEPGNIIDALIGTSLSAKPVASFRWSVRLSGAAR